MGGDFGYAGAGGGGASLSAFRSAVSPTIEALDPGAFGDDLEYASLAEMIAAGWAKTGATVLPDSDAVVGGSHVSIWNRGVEGRGFVKSGLTFPADFEVGALIKNPVGGMTGIGVHDGSGGMCAVHYGAAYRCHTSATHQYSGTLDGAGAPTTTGDLVICLRRLAGVWRVRYSNDDGGAWTVASSAADAFVTTPTKIWFGSAYSNDVGPTFRKILYGAPNLGLG